MQYQNIHAYCEYIVRLQRKWGDKFTDVGLTEKFRPYFGQRIEIETSYGEKIRGWVAGTTGWQPSLMLLAKRNSTGSSNLISDKDTLVRVINSGPR